MATIFRKITSRPLSNYQKRINQAAIDICLKSLGMLRNRQALIEAARSKVIADGFQFVKGQSRSNKTCNDSSTEPRPKRQKVNQDVREKRVKDVGEDLSDIKERIGYKEKRIAEYINISDYKKCDELKEEVIRLKKQQRELLSELNTLKVSQRKSNWYHGKKTADDSSTSASTAHASTSADDPSTSAAGTSATAHAQSVLDRSYLPPNFSPRTPESPGILSAIITSCHPVCS